MGSVNSKVSEDEAYLDLAGPCSGLSPVCVRLHLSSGQVQEDDHSRSWRVCRLLHPGCRLLRQERQVCRQVQESKESQVRVELFVLCVHLDCEELQLQQGQRLLEDRKGEAREAKALSARPLVSTQTMRLRPLLHLRPP